MTTAARSFVTMILLAGAVPALAGQSAEVSAPESSEIDTLRGEIERAAAMLAKLKQRLDQLESDTAGYSRPAPAPVPNSTSIVASSSAGAGDRLPASGTSGTIDKCAELGKGPQSPANATTSGTFDALESACGRTVAAVLLTGSSGSSGVTVKFTRATEGGSPDYSNGETLARRDVYTLAASAPLAKEGPTRVVSLDGFTNSSKLTFGFNRFALPLPMDAGLHPGYVSLVRKAQEACRRQAAAEEAAGKPLSYSRSCNEETDLLYERFLSGAEVALMEKMLAGQTVRRARAFGLELSIGHEEFKVRDSTTLAETDVSRVPLGAKASLSFFPWRRASLTGAIDYQRIFKAARTRIFCPTGSTSVSVECFTGSFDEPSRTEKILLSAELRKVFDFAKTRFIPRLGLAPRVEYDANNRDFAFNVPFYLAPDEKGKLIAGVQAGYAIAETDPSKPGKERDFTLGLFVGSTFNLP